MLIFYLQMLETPEERLRFEEIYEQYRHLMYRVARNVLRNPEDAEDAVHNAFLRVIRRFSRFQDAPKEDIAPQLVVIARNEAVSLLRKRRQVLPLEDWDGFAETAEAVADYEALVESFARLPQTYRAALEMKLLEGCSDGEIARRLGLTKSAVSTRVSRGRRLLRDIVTREGFFVPQKN
ncbi:MAG: sigma-70 family RNA polymerase sigma factor [Oscillospiraceae bacterium]|nr:sigma-70 family RNA polymerase sigma factor [Oscillospiraceae bacterium]